jgi:hypothetical protein
MVAAVLGHGSQDFAGDNDGGLTAEFNHFLDGVRIPGTQVLGHNTSFLAGILGHRFRSPQTQAN